MKVTVHAALMMAGVIEIEFDENGGDNTEVRAKLIGTPKMSPSTICVAHPSVPDETSTQLAQVGLFTVIEYAHRSISKLLNKEGGEFSVEDMKAHKVQA